MAARLPFHSIEHPKVLFFTTIMSREGGACYAFREMVKRVATQGIEPLVVIPECPDSFDMFPKSEFDVVYLKMQRPRRTWNALIHGRFLVYFPSTFLSLRRLIRQRGVHLVHFNEVMDFIAGMAAKSCGVPCICHVRAHRIPNPYRWPLLSILKATAEAIVVPSKYTAAWIASESTELASRVRLIYDYAFDVSSFHQPVSGSAFRDELGIPSDTTLVLVVSKLATPKGHRCFIRAAEKLLKVSKKFCFVVVGGPVPGHEDDASAIKALAEKLTAAPALRFVGPRSDLPAIYAASDVVVHCPVFPDTYPTVVLLAMLAGRPIIGTNIGGIPEQIEHNKTGIVVPPDDPSALADAILRLASDPAKRKSLGLAAKERMKMSWAPETQGQLLAELYSEVIQRKNGGQRSSRIQQSPVERGAIQTDM